MTPTFETISVTADEQFNQIWSELVVLEEKYLEKNGVYAQIVASPDDVPVDGDEVPFSLRAPSDFPSIGAFSFTDEIVFQISVDVWSGDNNGFTMNARFQVGEKVYKRTRSSENVDSGWCEEVTTEI